MRGDGARAAVVRRVPPARRRGERLVVASVAYLQTSPVGTTPSPRTCMFQVDSYLESYARVSDGHRQQTHPQTIEWISSRILAEPVEAHAVR